MTPEIIGPAALYRSDCANVLPLLDGVDHVITDPPYGDADTHNGHLSKTTLRDGTPARQALGFDGIGLEECRALTRQWCDLAARWVVFTCEWKYMHALDADGLLVRFGIWRKPDGAPQFTGDRPGMGWEAVAVCHRQGAKRWNGGGRHGVWAHAKGSNQSGHPTGKPVSLYAELIADFTDPGETILDPFMGSGSVGVAAVQAGRRFIGVDLDPKWYAVARSRIAAAEAQPDLFVARPDQVALFTD